MEWEARIPRSAGMVEFFGGNASALAGIAITDESSPAGFGSTLAGIGSTVTEFKDLKAEKRFFYPRSLSFQQDLSDEHMYGYHNRKRGKKDYTIHTNVAANEF